MLRASHIKPWRIASNAERLDCFNGQLLTENIDILFGHGLISFGDDESMTRAGTIDVAMLRALSCDPAVS